MKENSIEKLQERLETLHVTQNARLACNADDLDIREEIAEVEEEIKELQDDTNVDRENRAEETLKKMKQSIEKLKNRDGESMLMVDICIQNIICFYEKWEANSGK